MRELGYRVKETERNSLSSPMKIRNIWGWERYGCLGHGNEECESVPKVVEALNNIKAAGDYTTFVVAETGDNYSFGCGESSSLDTPPVLMDRPTDIQMFSPQNSGKLYAFGAADKGQLGSELVGQLSKPGKDVEETQEGNYSLGLEALDQGVAVGYCGGVQWLRTTWELTGNMD